MLTNFSWSSFIIGLILGLVLAGAWSLRDTLTPGGFATTTSTTNSSVTTRANNIVSVVNQSAGSSVTVTAIKAPASGVWVAVREVDKGSLGNVLGAARVSGSQENLSIALLRATEPGREYAIQLYRDDGSGSFTVASSSVYVDFDTSEPVTAHFSTN